SLAEPRQLGGIVVTALRSQDNDSGVRRIVKAVVGYQLQPGGRPQRLMARRYWKQAEARHGWNFRILEHFPATGEGDHGRALGQEDCNRQLLPERTLFGRRGGGSAVNRSHHGADQGGECRQAEESPIQRRSETHSVLLSRAVNRKRNR